MVSIVGFAVLRFARDSSSGPAAHVPSAGFGQDPLHQNAQNGSDEPRPGFLEPRYGPGFSRARRGGEPRFHGRGGQAVFPSFQMAMRLIVASCWGHRSSLGYGAAGCLASPRSQTLVARRRSAKNEMTRIPSGFLSRMLFNQLGSGERSGMGVRVSIDHPVGYDDQEKAVARVWTKNRS